ncbi:MAG: carbohydrate binding domain-containing protein [Chitinophagaceae bacterium]|nr:carbohydrate binding domain-containing protein [Chitinophagaceae bacterium]
MTLRPLRLLSILILAFSIPASAAGKHEGEINDEPDSVYLFSYGTNGLRFAWSLDNVTWNSIGNGYAYVKSDYGRWGSEKKMITPYLIQGRNGEWQCVWALNDYTPQFGHSSSKDLINWGPQSYPYVTSGKNVISPMVAYEKATDTYAVIYADVLGQFYHASTRDFKTYPANLAVTASRYLNQSVTIQLENEKVKGQLHRVAWTVVDKLVKAYELNQFKSRQNSETTREDSIRFVGLKAVNATILLHPGQSKPISDMLMGIFFEDINYAADGGLYAELIQNRGFEYHPRDKSNRDRNWNSKHAWSTKGDSTAFTIDSLSPVHPNNPHYAVLEVKQSGISLVNSGFDGIAVKKSEAYDFSAFVRQLKGSKGTLELRLVSNKAGVLATARVNNLSSSWKNIEMVFIPTADATDARLELQPLTAGSIAFDMVSLFPRNTYKNRRNGLRADLAQTIAEINPRFVRFPGGCVAHGDGIDNIYKWKNSIGPLESRKPDRNIWNYHQSMGLGYFEYFQFCEDIGAEPVPVIAAGVPCQNSGTGGGGQQGGIPMIEMGRYIQDIIDLVEYANGSVKTTWGKKRADAGHPKPFNLKYIGIGNEDQITEVFRERFDMIYRALRKAHPEITIIGTAGPFFEGTDYEEGWKIAAELNVAVIDEHYYQSPGWFINNQDFYDKYDRTKSKVYLGEYAASLPGGNKTNWETSLAEALYLTSLERNGDVVSMASYAPLIAKEGRTQWNPDLIYFNNTEVKPTTGYFIQKLFGQNAGNVYLPAVITLDNNQENIRKRIAYSVTRHTKTNEVFVKLVNMLPVEVNTTIDLSGIDLAESRASRTVLVGKPTDKTVSPIMSEIIFTEKTTLQLAPYSLTVLRMKQRH